MTHPLAEPIRRFAATLPDAWEDRPWGETAYKVGRKVFVYLSVGETFHLTLKLRDRHDEALAFPWVTPARYGLDRGGWVTCALPEDAPLEMVLGWIEESYGLVAQRRRPKD